MLSYDGAFSFLTDVLSLSHVARKLHESKHDLLCEIVKSYHEVFPFQGFTLMATPLAQRRIPTVSEILNQSGSQSGSLCYTLNVFMKLLLEALGYDVHHIISGVARPDNHIITIARIRGVKYLVEAGTGHPTFKPIPLNFKEESPVYEDSFIKYKFVWVSESKIERRHLFFTPGSTWQQCYTLDITPRSLKELDLPMSIVYTSEDAMPFHTSLRAIQFFDGKAVCIRDMKLLVEDDAHILQETNISSEEEFLEIVTEHFPLLVDSAKKALANRRIL